MKKSICFLLSIILIISIVFTGRELYSKSILNGNKDGFILFTAENESGYLDYKLQIDNTIFVYDVKNDIQSEFRVREYSKIFALSKYIGGQFACVGIKNNENIKYILMFKNGIVEHQIPIAFEKPDKFIATNEAVYYLINDEIIEQNIITYNTHVLSTNVKNFDISEEGELAYLLNDNKTLHINHQEVILDSYFTDIRWIENDILLNNSNGYEKLNFDNKTTEEVSSLSQCLSIDANNGCVLLCTFTNEFDTINALVNCKYNVKEKFFLNNSNLSYIYYSTNSRLWINDSL